MRADTAAAAIADSAAAVAEAASAAGAAAQPGVASISVAAGTAVSDATAAADAGGAAASVTAGGAAMSTDLPGGVSVSLRGLRELSGAQTAPVRPQVSCMRLCLHYCLEPAPTVVSVVLCGATIQMWRSTLMSCGLSKGSV